MAGVRSNVVFLFILSFAAAQETEKPTEAPLTESNAILFAELSSGLENFTVIDVRPRQGVIETGQIPGSHVLPLNELEESLALSEEEFLAKYGFPKLSKDDATLVLTCRTADKVREANAILEAHGYSKQRLYLGSYEDWVKNGGALTKPGKPFEPSHSEVSSTPVPNTATANSSIPREFIIF